MTLRPIIAAAWMCALGACASGGSGSTFLGSNPMADVSMPLQSIEERKFATVVRQRYDFSCGSAALATLLRFHYGDPQTEEAVFRGMWAEGDRAQIRKLGFSLLDMKRYLEERGLASNGYSVGLAQIEQAGVPGIALVTLQGYRHFVVVKGIKGGDVLVGDPARGLMAIPADEFAASWNGIFFVIDAALDRGRRNFNARHQWASFDRAPLGSRFQDPLSLQALSVTAPFYRDF